MRNGRSVNGTETELRQENPFTDLTDASAEVQDAILGWAYPQGILRGTTATTMNPNGRLTRAHVAAMLCRYDRLVVENKEPDGFPFRLAPPHTTEEFLTGNLNVNDTYTLLVNEDYTDSYYTVGSDNTKIVEVVYSAGAWNLRTKAEGTAFLTVTRQDTGEQWKLPVTVGGSSGNRDSGNIWAAALDAAARKSTAVYPDGPGPYRDERLEIIRLANEVRVQNGRKECVVSEALMSAAQKFAEMEPKEHDDHLQYQCRADFGCRHGVGCNLYYSTNAGSVQYLPVSAVRGWDQSLMHQAAMLNNGADTMGIGLHYNEETKTAYCVMFVGCCQTEGRLFGTAHD